MPIEFTEPSVQHDVLAHNAANKSYAMSGYSYVAAMLREHYDDWTLNGGLYRHYLQRLPLAAPEKCSHGVTICVRCAGSWTIDYRLLLWRTAGGRQLAKELHQDPEDDVPEQEYSADTTGEGDHS